MKILVCEEDAELMAALILLLRAIAAEDSLSLDICVAVSPTEASVRIEDEDIDVLIVNIDGRNRKLAHYATSEKSKSVIAMSAFGDMYGPVTSPMLRIVHNGPINVVKFRTALLDFVTTGVRSLQTAPAA